MEMNGKCAVMVGGASGFALATAKELMKFGVKIAILDLPTSKGEEVAADLGNGTTFHPCDVMDFEGTETSLNEAVEALGALHIAVNTAGGGAAIKTLGKDGPHPLDVFRRVIDLNLIGTFNCSRLQAYHMAKNDPEESGERGVIINTSSIAAFEGQIGQVSYTAAKAGIAGMSLTMARDLGREGIRVMTIAPSLFATGLTAGISDEAAASLVEGAAFPVRLGQPEEYAILARGIVENPMLNGGTIRLDAGQRFQPRIGAKKYK